MSTQELVERVKFLVDADGNKQAVVVDIELWDELITQLQAGGDTTGLAQAFGSGAESLKADKASSGSVANDKTILQSKIGRQNLPRQPSSLRVLTNFFRKRL